MANPDYIIFDYPDKAAGSSGYDTYAFLRRNSDDYIYDVGDEAFESVGTFNDARADECDIALTWKNAGRYKATFPSVAEGNYSIQLRLRAGASPAITDAILGSMAINQLSSEVLDEAVEGAITFRQAIRLFLSVLTGKSSGGGTTALVFRDMADTKNRLAVTVDTNGNRTTVGTRDGS